MDAHLGLAGVGGGWRLLQIMAEREKQTAVKGDFDLFVKNCVFKPGSKRGTRNDIIMESRGFTYSEGIENSRSLNKQKARCPDEEADVRKTGEIPRVKEGRRYDLDVLAQRRPKDEGGGVLRGTEGGGMSKHVAA